MIISIASISRFSYLGCCPALARVAVRTLSVPARLHLLGSMELSVVPPHSTLQASFAASLVKLSLKVARKSVSAFARSRAFSCSAFSTRAFSSPSAFSMLSIRCSSSPTLMQSALHPRQSCSLQSRINNQMLKKRVGLKQNLKLQYVGCWLVASVHHMVCGPQEHVCVPCTHSSGKSEVGCRWMARNVANWCNFGTCLLEYWVLEYLAHACLNGG